MLLLNVTHDGYKDPSNLKFDDIVVLGVPQQPTFVVVTHGNLNTSLSSANINYDEAKKVNTDTVMQKHKIKTISILVFDVKGNYRKH